MNCCPPLSVIHKNNTIPLSNGWTELYKYYCSLLAFMIFDHALLSTKKNVSKCKIHTVLRITCLVTRTNTDQVRRNTSYPFFINLNLSTDWPCSVLCRFVNTRDFLLQLEIRWRWEDLPVVVTRITETRLSRSPTVPLYYGPWLWALKKVSEQRYYINSVRQWRAFFFQSLFSTIFPMSRDDTSYLIRTMFIVDVSLRSCHHETAVKTN